MKTTEAALGILGEIGSEKTRTPSMNYTQLQAVLTANIKAQTIAQRDYKKAQAEADKWEQRYQLALIAGREYLIQEAQFRQNICAKKASNLKALLDEQTERVANLKHKFFLKKQIEANFQTIAKLPSNDLKMRSHKVETELEAMNTQLVSQQVAISKLLKHNSAILDDVRNQLSQTTIDADFELNSTDEINQLINLESEIDLDDEIVNLKKALTISTTSQNHNSLPSAGTVQIVDVEFEDLRKQLDKL